MSNLRSLATVADALPWSVKTLYNRGQAGTLPFLTRIGPEGRRTREWWVDIDLLRGYATARGIRLELPAQK